MGQRNIGSFLQNLGENIYRYHLRRACMYVPGNDAKKIQKAATLNVDCVVLDCEDGVAFNMKAQARDTIRESLDTMKFHSSNVGVRINPVSSGLMEQDLTTIFRAEHLPSTIYLPKLDHSSQLDQFSQCLSSCLQGRTSSVPAIPTLIYVESCIAVLNLKEILMHASKHHSDGGFYVDGVVFGSDDFCADLGVSRSKEGTEIEYARQHVVLCAKAYGLQAIDMVYIDYKDIDGLIKNCMDGVKLGYTGKQVIHPQQVPVVQDAFSPTQTNIDMAKRIIHAFTEHEKTGKGAFTFEDRMIDMPTVLQAKRIVQMAEKIYST